ncbi:hypothetical protein QEH59_17510 [Coraliomargarita sp. SDUM461004]|uniref:Uncharacterized protein n=1 Tax=Thalassobacterium sedimentorum TaxID=3041258 RepID=A0ABU1AR29_9BACT|nr:hypothetical protein [Coraliomargarita sp. SDUM461004]MDQ8196236.1 hypothetical protein [Coraliomargarita sp. SDUM461004]
MDPNENNQPSASHPTNWLLGLDKVTAPTFEYLGFKLRDTVKSYLKSKTRERIATRRLEKNALIRHNELLYYSADQFASSFTEIEEAIVAKAIKQIERPLRNTIVRNEMQFDRVIEIMTHALRNEDISYETDTEDLVHQITRSIFDSLIAISVIQHHFHYCQLPHVLYRQNPLIEDDEIDEIMSSEETIERLSEELENEVDDEEGSSFVDHLVALLRDIYNIPEEDIG